MYNNEIGTVDNDVARSKNTLSIPWRTAWYAARGTVGVPRLPEASRGIPPTLVPHWWVPLAHVAATKSYGPSLRPAQRGLAAVVNDQQIRLVSTRAHKRTQCKGGRWWKTTTPKKAKLIVKER